MIAAAFNALIQLGQFSVRNACNTDFEVGKLTAMTSDDDFCCAESQEHSFIDALLTAKEGETVKTDDGTYTAWEHGFKTQPDGCNEDPQSASCPDWYKNAKTEGYAKVLHEKCKGMNAKYDKGEFMAQFGFKPDDKGIGWPPNFKAGLKLMELVKANDMVKVTKLFAAYIPQIMAKLGGAARQAVHCQCTQFLQAFMDKGLEFDAKKVTYCKGNATDCTKPDMTQKIHLESDSKDFADVKNNDKKLTTIEMRLDEKDHADFGPAEYTVKIERGADLECEIKAVADLKLCRCSPGFKALARYTPSGGQHQLPFIIEALPPVCGCKDGQLVDRSLTTNLTISNSAMCAKAFPAIDHILRGFWAVISHIEVTGRSTTYRRQQQKGLPLKHHFTKEDKWEKLGDCHKDMFSRSPDDAGFDPSKCKDFKWRYVKPQYDQFPGCKDYICGTDETRKPAWSKKLKSECRDGGREDYMLPGDICLGEDTCGKQK